MKECKSCLRTLSLEDFHRQTRARDGLQSRCKDCNKEQRKEYYKTAHGKAKNDLTGKRWQNQMMKKVFEHLSSQQCVDCCESNPLVLDFDHRVPEEKSFSIATGIRKGYGWTKLLSEIEKCDVRCANCHRKRTAEQFGWAKLVWMGEAMVD